MFKLTKVGQDGRHLKKKWTGLRPEFPVCIKAGTQTHTYLAKVATLASVSPLAARLRWVREHLSC